MKQLALTCACVVVSLTGCGSEPRSREEIFRDQMAVETLYFTSDGREIVAPGSDRGMIVDEESGELAFAAWQCENPDCPGRNGDEPHLFPLPDPFAYADASGQPAIRQPISDEDFARFEEFIDRKCPACIKQRDLASETPQQRQQYQAWVTHYMTPQALERLAELEAELKRLTTGD